MNGWWIFFTRIALAYCTDDNYFWMDNFIRGHSSQFFFEQMTWPFCTAGNFFRTDNLTRVQGRHFFFQMDNLIPADGFLFFLNGWLDPCAWLRTAYTRLFVWKQQIERNVSTWEVTNVETLAINYFFLLCKFKYKRSLSYLGMRMKASYSSAALVSYAILCSISNLVSFFLHFITVL